MSEVTEQVEEQVEEQEQEEPTNKYQDILNRAQALRQAGAINAAELTVVSLTVQAIFALGMDIAADLRTLADHGIQNESTGGEGETSQMDLPFEGDNGDESAV
jgi:hypothetical protein